MLLTGLKFLLIFANSAFAMHRNDFWIPQTHTLPKGSWQVSVDRQALIQKRKGEPPGTGHESTFGTSFGIWQKSIVSVEGGLDWHEPASDNLNEGIFGHLRISVSNVKEYGWAVALGVERLGFVANQNDINLIYVALQNQLANVWITEVGGYNGSSRFLVDHNGEKDPRGVFVGVWRQIQQSKGRIGIEYQSGVNFLGATNFGMTLELSDFVYGTIAYGIANNQNLMRDWLITRIAVDF